MCFNHPVSVLSRPRASISLYAYFSPFSPLEANPFFPLVASGFSTILFVIKLSCIHLVLSF